MPYRNEHAARILNPSKFEKDSFRRKKIETHQVQSFRQKIILSELQAFSNIDILSIIEPNILQEIKQNDPHPFFKAYIIAHEGTSSPKIINEGYKEISWGKRAIKSIKNAIKKGIQFFKGHNEDNSIENRKSLGEVVGNIEKEIDGKLNNIVIGYFPPEHRNEVENYNICSMEAVWNIIQKSGKLIGDTIHELTGIALGNSNYENPAWAGAKEIACVQAFTNQERGIIMSEDSKITFGIISSWIKDHNVWPSQLFSIDEIKKDREFKNISENENKIIDLEKQNNEYQNELKSIQEQYDKIKIEQQKSNISSRIEKIGIEQKWTDRQKKYILSKINEIKNYDDNGIEEFIKSKTDDYKITAQIFNSETETINNIENKENTNEKDYTKAKNNELLEVDYGA